MLQGWLRWSVLALSDGGAISGDRIAFRAYGSTRQAAVASPGIRIEHRLPARGGRLPNFAGDLDFHHPQFPVDDDQEVVTAAGRIEECQVSELRMERSERCEAAPTPPTPHPLEPGAQVVHEAPATRPIPSTPSWPDRWRSTGRPEQAYR